MVFDQRYLSASYEDGEADMDFSVYTTTNKKIKDPTAYRLESFWWHVWGSDRRYLSGATLAKLFKQISSGPTFVPLKELPNRFGAPPVF